MADLATPMAIRVAATLGLAERAGSEGATAEHLAAETGTARRRYAACLITWSRSASSTSIRRRTASAPRASAPS